LKFGLTSLFVVSGPIGILIGLYLGQIDVLGKTILMSLSAGFIVYVAIKAIIVYEYSQED
jgi:zinc transporter ZupT